MGRGHLAWVPLASTPLQEPSDALLVPSEHPGCSAGQEGGRGREGGGALGLSRSHSWEEGAGGLWLARPLPGTQGPELSLSLAWAWG